MRDKVTRWMPANSIPVVRERRAALLDGSGRQLNERRKAIALQGMLEFIKQAIGRRKIITDVAASWRRAHMISPDHAPHSQDATRLLAGIVVPNTPIVTRAVEYAREHCEPYLFNHQMRSWLFSVAIAQLKGAPHDPEVLAVITLLHDIGLAEAFSGPLRFEVEGANAARAFARAQGMVDGRAQLVWDGVALNSTPSISLYKQGEVALATMGIGLDWGGWGYDLLTESQLGTILQAFPRLEMKQQFTRDVCRIVESRPDTTYDNFTRDFGERFVPGYSRPSTVDFLLNAPFTE